MEDESRRARLNTLTRRQRQILLLRCEGKTLAEIAQAIDREERTVKDHMGNIYEKLALDHLKGTARDLELADYCRTLHEMPPELPPKTGEPEPEPQPASALALVAVMEDELPLIKAQPTAVDVWAPLVPRPPLEVQRRPRLRGMVLAVVLAVGGGVIGAVLTAILVRPAPQVVVREVVATSPPVVATRVVPQAAPTRAAAALPTSTRSSPTASPRATSEPTSIPGPPPEPGTVLYVADWGSSSGLWPPAPGWSVATGVFVFNPRASNASATVFAPYEPGALTNYAVEAEIQAVDPDCPQFGVVLRSGYVAGIDSDCTNHAALGTVSAQFGHFYDIAKQNFRPTREWRTYRAEVFGNNLRLFVDGTLMVEAPDNRYLSGGKVGFFAKTQMGVRSFKVIAL